MTQPSPGTPQWLQQVQEEILEPERRIVDPHHHLWEDPRGTYGLEQLWADTGAGHFVDKTVFVECRASYRPDGPTHLQPVGETEFVARIAEQSRAGSGATIAAIVAHADLTLAPRLLDEVLDAHEEAAHGLFRGIRHAGACDPHPGALRIPGRAPAELYERADFRAGLARLGERGLTYDTWQYHHQLPAFERLARAVPDTTLVLDHFSTPLGVGAYRGQRESIFERWKHDLAAVAACPNVVAKLGGLAMPDNGFGWSERNSPASSDEIATAHAPYYHHALECFGANRCMLESNFPVDKLSVSYAVLWNGLKKLVAACTDEEKDHLFSGTAERTYRI